jgi:hypothetical protein
LPPWPPHGAAVIVGLAAGVANVDDADCVLVVPAPPRLYEPFTPWGTALAVVVTVVVTVAVAALAAVGAAGVVEAVEVFAVLATEVAAVAATAKPAATMTAAEPAAGLHG